MSESRNQDKARVFISCGQASGEEQTAARKIGEVLAGLGFDYYVAVQEASLVGLKENVFRQLEESEYILFVDFKRDQLANRDVFRGSLFSHQELAVAAYLGLDWLPFRQEGVERQGIMSFIQANAVTFSSADELPQLVRTHVERVGWNPAWKNALRIDGPSAPIDAKVMDLEYASGGSEPLNARFYHLEVMNRNPRKLALSCTAYVERVSGVARRPVELRWAGFDNPAATILPASSRPLDAGFVLHPQPAVFSFHSFSTSSQFTAPVRGPGEFEVEYVVVSDGFPPARATFTITLGMTLDDVKIERK